MNGDDKDPMLSGDADEQTNYRDGVRNAMRDAIEEDRRNRREQPKVETPAVLIGGTGFSGGLTQGL